MKLRSVSLLLCSLLAAGLLSADSVVEEIVARVNNDIITRSEYQRSRDELLNELKQKFGSDADTKFQEQQKNVLRDLIDQDLLVEKGKDLGISADTELVKRLDEMRKQMHLESMEDLEKAAQEQGVSFEDFKNNVRNQIITQEVIGREVGAKMQITHEEEQQYYDQHRSELEQPEQVRLSEILISTQPNQPEGEAGKDLPQPTPEQLAAAEQKAREVLQQIKSGTKFEDIAKKSSDGPTSAEGGDLGYFKRGMLAKELEDITFNMKPGDVSDVIRTKQGFVILKVTEHTQAGIPPLNKIEPQIQDAIYYQKLQPALRTYLTKLREEAYIDIKPGYEDSGASPNETKPIYTTASAETPKAKKKKKHFLLF
jgi:peptidyl-prolyl cis-trans isomerase SurA